MRASKRELHGDWGGASSYYDAELMINQIVKLINHQFRFEV